MKHTIKYIGFGLASVLALSSCSDQFLQDKKNFDNVTEEVYNYVEGAQSRVDDVYSWCMPSVGDLAWNNPSMGNNDLAGSATEEYSGFGKFNDPSIELSASATDSKIQVPDFFMNTNNNIQASVYGRIRNCNDCIQGIKNSTLDESQKNKFLGQLYFLRAWCYYNLVKWYGGVPIVEEVQEPNESTYNERKSAKACFDFILNDLRNSAKLLKGVTMTGSDYGRITSGTALALKGRVLTLWCSPLFNRKDDASRWDAAYTEMLADKAEIDACGYGLYKAGNSGVASDFAGQFLVAGSNPEAVFFTLHNKVASDDGLDNQKNNRWERDIRPSNTGGGGKRASKMILDLFPMSDGRLPSGTANYTNLKHSSSSIDATAPFMNRDPRFYRTFAFPGFRWAYSGDPTQRDGHNPSYNQGHDYVYWGYVWYTEKSSAGDVESGTSYASDNISSGGVYVRKKSDDFDINTSPLYEYAPKATKGAGPFFSGATLIELRYAEVLLNLAEVACGANKVPAALSYLNQVRQRVGKITDITAADFLGAQDASCMSAILYERMVEFAYEGKRFDDLRRWMLYDGGTTLPSGAPDTWKLGGRWSAGTDNWLGIKKLNDQRREKMVIRTATRLDVGGTDWNSDPVLKDSLTKAAQRYVAKHPEYNEKKAKKLMEVYTEACDSARKVSVNLNEDIYATGGPLEKLKAWYEGTDVAATGKARLTIDEKPGDGRNTETGVYWNMNFRPQYYFLGFSSGAQTANKHVLQTIGWDDTNHGGKGTFDPLAE